LEVLIIFTVGDTALFSLLEVLIIFSIGDTAQAKRYRSGMVCKTFCAKHFYGILAEYYL